MKKVVVAMSGGVDSSVAAALLKDQGFAVEGVFMKNWSPQNSQSLTDCPWETDQNDAAAVCEVLGIPFRSVNFEREYKDKVVDYFLREYAAGRTPNPDVMCNKEIKFDAFLKMAEEMGADYIATGHYARVIDDKLYRGIDGRKDQSYFLWTLDPNKLSKTLMPVGEYRKDQIRLMAKEYGLPTASKKDSQGICFIGHLDLKGFLMDNIVSKMGDTYLVGKAEVGNNKVERLAAAQLIGRHSGSMYYTIGERGGNIIDNKLWKKLRNSVDVPPVYVLAKDFEKNIVFVTDDHEDRDFYDQIVTIEDWQLCINNQYYTNNDKALDQAAIDTLKTMAFQQLLQCQIRYQQKQANIISDIIVDGNTLQIQVSDKLWALAPGQSLVIYNNEEVIGGGIIH